MNQQKKKLYVLARFLQSSLGITVIVISIVLLLSIFVFMSSGSTDKTVSYEISNPSPTGINVISNVYPTTNPAVVTSSLSFSQDGPTSVSINLNSGIDAVSGVQLAIAYDPSVLDSITINQGSFFNQPDILQNSIDTTKGIIVYSLAIPPNGNPKTGAGTVATITYAIKTGTIKNPTFSFLPATKVTAEGINDSVLKQKHNITFQQK